MKITLVLLLLLGVGFVLAQDDVGILVEDEDDPTEEKEGATNDEGGDAVNINSLTKIPDTGKPANVEGLSGGENDENGRSRSFSGGLGGLSSFFVPFIPECGKRSTQHVCYKYDDLIQWQRQCPRRTCWFRPRYVIYNGRRVRTFWKPEYNYPAKIYTTECIKQNMPCYGGLCSQTGQRHCPSKAHNWQGYCPKRLCRTGLYRKVQRNVVIKLDCGYFRRTVHVYYPRDCTCKTVRVNNCRCAFSPILPTIFPPFFPDVEYPFY